MINYNDLTKNIKDGLKFPTGATSERGNPSKGSLRFNSETGKPEIYAKSRGWKSVAQESSGSSAVYKIAVGARYDDDNGSSSGSVYVYDLDGSNEVKITASDGESNDEFGYSVAVGHSKIVVGALQDDDNGFYAGAVYVYDLDGSNEVKITPSDGSSLDYFGGSVAVGNSKIVVGSRGDNDNGSDSGSVYVYDLDGSNEVKITASDGASSDYFGYSVVVGDSKIVVGAPYDDDNGSQSGSVYVYNLDGSNEVKITASDGSSNDYFGRAVAVGDSKVVVGAYWDADNGSDSGSVYVYDLDGSNEVKITASDGYEDDRFGVSVAVGNDKIVVGTTSGSFYVYDLDGSNEVKITASDGETGDRFGYSVAVIDSKIIAGEHEDEDNGKRSGSVYVYDLDGSNEVKISASDGASYDFFGLSVSAG
jgi:Tol biopolymer transport system component